MSAIRRAKKAPISHEDRLGSAVYSSKDNDSMHQSSNGDFILYRLLIDQILTSKFTISFGEQSLGKYFHPDELNDQALLKEFDDKYESKDAIFWYTRESPVYKNLNKALRTQNIEDVSPFSAFIRDLNQQLADEHRKFVREQKTSQLTVYRGQLISKDEILRLKSSPGELLAMNSFLSTSTNRKKAFEFATSRPPPSDELARVLLELHVDLHTTSRPYADIKRLSAFPDEEEILFVVGCVFRIDRVHFDEKNELWMAEMTLCSQDSHDVKQLNQVVNKEVTGQNQTVALAKYLLDMNKYNQAQIFLENLLQNEILKTPEDIALARITLGKTALKKGNYKVSREHFQTAVDVLAQGSEDNEHPLISECYNHIASVFCVEGNHDQAYYFYEKALNTPKNNDAITYFGLADLRRQTKTYQLALNYLEKILHNESQLTHAFRSSVYLQMAANYSALDKDKEAEQVFAKLLRLQKDKVGSEHPDLSYTYLEIAAMHLERDKFDQAWMYLEKAHDLQMQTLPSAHPDFAETYQSYALFFLKKKDFDKALEYYEKRLINQLQTLEWNHPNVMTTYAGIGKIHWQKKEYDHASEYFEEILRAEKERRKTGETSLSVSYQTLGNLYYEKFELLKDESDLERATPFYLNFLQNELESKLAEDFTLVETYQRLAWINAHKQQFDQALQYHMRTLDCHQRKLPVDQKQVDEIYRAISKIMRQRTRFDQRLLPPIASQNHSTGRTHEQIETIYFQRRQLDQAALYFQEKFERTKEKHGRHSAALNKFYAVVGNIDYEQGNPAEALKSFSRLLSNELQRKPVEHSSLEKVYRALATILAEQNDVRRALIYFYRLLDCLYRQQGKQAAIEEVYEQMGKTLLNQDQPKPLTKLDQRLINYSLESHCLHQMAGYFEDLVRTATPKTRRASSTRIFKILTMISMQKQVWSRALTYCQKVLAEQAAQHPYGHVALVDTYITLSDIYRHQGQLGLAVQSSRQAIDLLRGFDPHNQALLERSRNQIQNILAPLP